jgi:hypothetical protein
MASTSVGWRPVTRAARVGGQRVVGGGCVVGGGIVTYASARWRPHVVVGGPRATYAATCTCDGEWHPRFIGVVGVVGW